MRVSSVFNRFFNGAEASADPVGQAPIDLADQDMSMIASLTMALTEATEKFARNELADAYKIDGTRWNLTGIQVFVRAANPQQRIVLKRKPSRVFRNLALRVIEASQPYNKMFVMDKPNFYGMTIEDAPDTVDGDWINVLGTYGKNETISYAFAFLGDYADADASAATKGKASADADLAQAHTTSRSPESKYSLGSAPTPMLGDAQLSLQSAHFWPKGVPMPYEQMALVDLHHLPVTLGRAPVTNLNQTLPWGVQDGCFVPLYGSPYISQQHLRLSLNEQGKPCVTDLSSHGTWLNGVRLPKHEAVELPATGALSLIHGPGAQQTQAVAVLVSFTQDTRAWPAAPSAPVEPAKAVASAPVAAPAKSMWPEAFTRKSTSAATDRKEPKADFGLNLTPDDIAACLPSHMPISMHSQPTDIGPGSVPTNMGGVDDQPSAASQPTNALAVLRVRTADGQESTHPITDLPFEIGREAQGGIPEACTRVSRVHLRIEGQHGRNALQVSNAGYTSMGTYNAGRREDARFIASLLAPQDKGGWFTLGGAQLSALTVQVRLEAVR